MNQSAPPMLSSSPRIRMQFGSTVPPGRLTHTGMSGPLTYPDISRPPPTVLGEQRFPGMFPSEPPRLWAPGCESNSSFNRQYENRNESNLIGMCLVIYLFYNVLQNSLRY